jgi:hypothetical protein
MSRSGDGSKPKTLEEMGVSREEIDRLTIQIYEQQIASATKYLTQAFQVLGKASGRNDKAKGSLVELAASVSSMAETISGLAACYQGKHNEIDGVLGEVVEGKDDFEKAINARYRLKLSSILSAATERQLKELKENK